MNIYKNFGFLIFISGILFIISGCGKSNNQAGPHKMPPISVTVAKVEEKDVPLEFAAIGTVEAYSTVSVLTQVGGVLTHVYFKEGEFVKKGQILFKIDISSYETQLHQAEANLSRSQAQVKQAIATLTKDSAQLALARSDVKRYDGLIKNGVVTQQEYDQIKTYAETMEATIEADIANINTSEESVRASRAEVENAKIQLGYCTIYSPIDGRTGNLIVDEGNVVKAVDKPLVVINQLNPIYVSFTVPEQELSNIKKYMSEKKLHVKAIIPSDGATEEEGILSFLNNAVDRNTGTIQLKGSFTNHDRRLWPGQFVNVVLRYTIQPNTIVIPSEAIQNGQEGQYVFVVKNDHTVEMRKIDVSRTQEHDSVIEKGLSKDETVVTDGQLKLTPGASVEIKASTDTTTNSPTS